MDKDLMRSFQVDDGINKRRSSLKEQQILNKKWYKNDLNRVNKKNE